MEIHAGSVTEVEPPSLRRHGSFDGNELQPQIIEKDLDRV
jgi:hypothetical protein